MDWGASRWEAPFFNGLADIGCALFCAAFCAANCGHAAHAGEGVLVTFPRGEIRWSQPGGLGQIDPETVAAALIAAGHFDAGMAELFLDVAFVHLG